MRKQSILLVLDPTRHARTTPLKLLALAFTG